MPIRDCQTVPRAFFWYHVVDMKHLIFGVRIDDVSLDELNKTINDWLEFETGKVIVTPNAEFLLCSNKNQTFKNDLLASDLSLPDGVSLRFAIAAITDNYLQSHYPGVDLVSLLTQACAARGKKILFFGGDDNSAMLSVVELKKRFNELDAQYFNPGHIRYEGNDLIIQNEIIDMLNKMNPDVVAVALGQAKQERFIFQMRERAPNVRIWIGVGGSFEMISKLKPRSPAILCKIGFEWLWRLIIEPKRFPRIFKATIIFPIAVVCATLKQRRLTKAVIKVTNEIFKQLKGL